MKYTTRIGIGLCVLALCAETQSAKAETAKVGQYTYTYRVVDGKAEIYNNGGRAVTPLVRGTLNIPAQLNGLPVTAIGEGAFISYWHITSVNIPEGVTSIGGSAFTGCYALSSVKLPKTLTSIGSTAFTHTSLSSLTLPGGVIDINEIAFRGCSNLVNISVETNNPKYASEDGVLYDKVQKKLMQFPPAKAGVCRVAEGTIAIGTHAFYDCNRLTSILVDSNNVSYASVDGVLFNKAKTMLIKCPAKKIGVYRLPDGVVDINYGAFERCSDLTSITLPASVKSIGSGAFRHCAKLASILVDEDNADYASVNGVLFNKQKNALVRVPCAKKGAYNIPDGVDVIRSYAFSDCAGLTSIVIPESVTFIANDAFCDFTGLTSVTIPKNVTMLGSGAFFSCSRLATVTLKCAKLAQDTRTTFANTPVQKLIVPPDMGWTNGEMFGGKPVEIRK